MKNRYHFPHKIFYVYKAWTEKVKCIIHRRTHTNALMIRTHRKKKKIRTHNGTCEWKKNARKFILSRKGWIFSWFLCGILYRFFVCRTFLTVIFYFLDALENICPLVVCMPHMKKHDVYFHNSHVSPFIRHVEKFDLLSLYTTIFLFLFFFFSQPRCIVLLSWVNLFVVVHVGLSN